MIAIVLQCYIVSKCHIIVSQCHTITSQCHIIMSHNCFTSLRHSVESLRHSITSLHQSATSLHHTHHIVTSLRQNVTSYRSSECFSVPKDPQVVGDPESAELKNERLEGRVGLYVECGVHGGARRGRSVVEQSKVVLIHPHVIDHGEVLKEYGDVRLGAVVHQLDGRMGCEKL